MYSNFEALPSDKKKRILDAAFREFGRYGYKKTSIEQIAKQANISKGMVFHYFHNKVHLFEYLTKHAFDFFMEWLATIMEQTKGLDFIEQYRFTTKLKMSAYMKKPQLFEFNSMLFLNPENIKISPLVENLYQEIMQLRQSIIVGFKNSSQTDNFLDTIDKEKTKTYIGYLIDGYIQHLLSDIAGSALIDLSLDNYWVEFDELLDDLKHLFYKKEADQ